MDGELSTAPSSEHVRSSSWGGPEARAELRRIADDARLRAGFEVASIEGEDVREQNPLEGRNRK